MRECVRSCGERAGLEDSSEPVQFADLALDPRGHLVFVASVAWS